MASVRSAARDLWREGRGWILFGVAGGWFLSIGIRLVFPALLPYFRSSFDLTLTTSGLLITVLWYAYALGQFPGGVFGDRFGARAVLAGSTLISAAAILAVAIAWAPIVLFVATAFFGFATALYGTTRFTILTDLYSNRDGTAVALTLAAGDLGNATLPLIAVSLAALYSWRVGIGFAVPLFLVMCLFLWVVVPGERPSSDREPTVVRPGRTTVPLGDIWNAVRARNVLLVAGVQFLGFFAWQGFTSFFVTYLVEGKGLTPGTASSLFGFFFLLGLLVRPITGAGYDRFGPRRTLAVTFGFITVGLVGLSIVQDIVPLVLITFCLGSLLGFTPLTQTFIANALPSHLNGSGLGLLRTAHILFGATSAVMIGYIADLGYFDEAFLLLAGFSAAAGILSLALPQAAVD